MKVACLVPYPLRRVPSQRYRLEQWVPLLRRRGIETTFHPLLDDAGFAGLYESGRLFRKAACLLRGSLARAAWALRDARHHDVVVIHREATPFGLDWVERFLSSRVPTLFDFDDAIWLPNVSRANRRFAWLKRPAKTDRILRHVAAVSAGCDYLARHARSFNPSVSLVPTSIDLDAYGPPRRHIAGDRLVVGWSGSLTTASYLQLLGRALRRAAESFPLKVIVYGAQVELPGIDTECIPWSPETEVDVLRRFDVGIKPMPSEEWVRGKCPMKELQYMSLGVPPVAARFGTAGEAIDHGVTGLLCSSEDDWVEALATLRSPDLRARFGAAGRRTVEERYSAERAAAAFEGAMNAAVAGFERRRAAA